MTDDRDKSKEFQEWAKQFRTRPRLIVSNTFVWAILAHAAVGCDQTTYEEAK